MGDEDDEDGSDEENMDEDECFFLSGEVGDVDVVVMMLEQVEFFFGVSIVSLQEKVVEIVVIEIEVDDIVLGVCSLEKVIVMIEIMMIIMIEILMIVLLVMIDVKLEVVNGVVIEGDRLELLIIVLMLVLNGYSFEKMLYEFESLIVVEFDLNGEYVVWVLNGGD